MDRLHLGANVHESADDGDAVAAGAVAVNAEHCLRSDHEFGAAKSLSHGRVVQPLPLIQLHGDVMIAPIAKREHKTRID